MGINSGFKGLIRLISLPHQILHSLLCHPFYYTTEYVIKKKLYYPPPLKKKEAIKVPLCQNSLVKASGMDKCNVCRKYDAILQIIVIWVD